MSSISDAHDAALLAALEAVKANAAAASEEDLASSYAAGYAAAAKDAAEAYALLRGALPKSEKSAGRVHAY